MFEDIIDKIKDGICSLTVFRTLKNDPVISKLYDYLNTFSISDYSNFVSSLYEANYGELDKYIKEICENSDTVYVRLKGKGENIPSYIEESVNNELKVFQMIANLSPNVLQKKEVANDFLPKFSYGNYNIIESYKKRVEEINKFGYGIYAKNHMFYIEGIDNICPVKNPDDVTLSNLIGYKEQRQKVIDNTVALLKGKPAANVLLTGDAGTGKSSTIKAIGNEYAKDGLRIVEIHKDQIRNMGRILDKLAENPLKFILFIDDLSFSKGDDSYSHLKAILEGSISAKSRNVVIYATSNRRHVVSESFSDRDGDDIHRNDTMQELVSLSDRFGLQVTFSKPGKDTYLEIVYHLAKKNNLDNPKEELDLLAERFALERGGRSARLARQFVDYLISKKEG